MYMPSLMTIGSGIRVILNNLKGYSDGITDEKDL
jgi:hypothetical protein